MQVLSTYKDKLGRDHVVLVDKVLSGDGLGTRKGSFNTANYTVEAGTCKFCPGDRVVVNESGILPVEDVNF